MKFVENDFITTIVKGMRSLFDKKKENLLYHLGKCFEGPVPRMSLDRMPFGLIDYNIRFFASNNSVNVRMEEQYAKWLETMFAQFGHKWLCLHRGPVWQYEFEKPVIATGTCANEQDLIKEALEESSIDLSHFSHSAENEEYLDLNADMCNLSVSDSTVGEGVNAEEHSGGSVSHLWTSVKGNDRLEIETGLISPAEMEKLHRVTPTCPNKIPRNPDLYNPLKVCI